MLNFLKEGGQTSPHEVYTASSLGRPFSLDAVRARASQVFEPNILIDPAELRSESSVERLEQANKYLKQMAYKKVRNVGVQITQGARGAEGRISKAELSSTRRRCLPLFDSDPFDDLRMCSFIPPTVCGAERIKP